jgi:hypothetical protein
MSSSWNRNILLPTIVMAWLNEFEDYERKCIWSPLWRIFTFCVLCVCESVGRLELLSYCHHCFLLAAAASSYGFSYASKFKTYSHVGSDT